MVKLRLKRIGKKKNAIYRIVASDSRVQRDGKYLDLLGFYHPMKDEIKLNERLTIEWLFNGAQPTDTVRSILSKNGVLKIFHEEKLAKKLANKKIEKSTNNKSAKKVASKLVNLEDDSKKVKVNE